MRRRPKKANQPPQLMLSPMIDMIFLLLVFFIVGTMYMSELRSIPIQLPQAKNSETLKKSSFTVSIKKDGSLFLDDIPIELEQLIKNVKIENENNPEFFVMIRAEEEVNYKTVIKLIDELRGTGVNRLGLATDLEDKYDR
ncbi:biopolymer transporter ExbD [Fusobacterium nucleatum]|uniref:ExbD/TolR family protein n=1 Tax=Fusobacterium nucleatum TaxID=851 RepID=UPI0030A3DE47